MLLYFIFCVKMTFRVVMNPLEPVGLWRAGGFSNPVCAFLAGVLRWQLLEPSHSFGAEGEGIMDSVGYQILLIAVLQP